MAQLKWRPVTGTQLPTCWQACLMGRVKHKSSTFVSDLSTACSPVCLGPCVQVQEAKSVLIHSGQLPDEASNLAEQVQELSVN